MNGRRVLGHPIAGLVVPGNDWQKSARNPTEPSSHGIGAILFALRLTLLHVSRPILATVFGRIGTREPTSFALGLPYLGLHPDTSGSGFSSSERRGVVSTAQAFTPTCVVRVPTPVINSTDALGL